MAIYLDYDQEGLDAQYNCRAMVSDAEDHIARWVNDSATARNTLRCDLDVAYGSAAAEKLDIFPASDGSPVMVFIHGGYWRSMDKADHNFPALAFVPAGIACVAINYALAPGVDMDEIVRQCRAALAWVYRNAASFGGDPSQIYVSGHSAGGHLTAMMMATDWPAEAEDLPRDLVKGGCPISGLYDLEPIRLTYLNEDVRLDDAQTSRHSPMFLAPMGVRWMIITTGALESSEFHRQQAGLVERWRDRGIAATTVDSPNRHHFNVVSQLAEPASPLFVALLEAIGTPHAPSR